MKFRSFKSRGGIIVLFWLVCTLLVLYRLYRNIKSRTEVAIFVVALVLGTTVTPLSGLLGDVVLGRYKAIRVGLCTIWIATICRSLVEAFAVDYGFMYSTLWQIISGILLVIGSVGGVILQVNLLNLGIDQLQYAPSWQISSFINWFCWCFFAADVIRVLIYSCSFYLVQIVRSVSVSLAMTAGLSLDLIFSKDFVREPISPNPISLIWKVLKYAAKNKYPKLRSAFSYWDEKKSRLDLSKRKYGGPFESDEVESVKSFLRMVGIVLVFSLLAGHLLVFDNIKDFLFFRFKDSHYVTEKDDAPSDYAHCMVRHLFKNASSFLVVLGVPIFECFIYPLLWKYDSTITTFKKIIAGVCFLLVSQLNYLGLEIVSDVQISSKNMTCLFQANETDLTNGFTNDISFLWLGVPAVSSAAAYYLLFTTAMEFLCAQSPYSMKGLLTGSAYSSVAIFSLVIYGFRSSFTRLTKEQPSCGIWYFASSAAITGIMILFATIAFNWYSKRRRRDNYDDESSTENCDLPHSTNNIN